LEILVGADSLMKPSTQGAYHNRYMRIVNPPDYSEFTEKFLIDAVGR